MIWDRSKQNYFILRRGDPWSVCNAKTGEYICDFPAYFSCGIDKLTENICFAKDDESVKVLVASIPPEELEKHKKMLRIMRGEKPS